ncbi:MAG: hypothetical protein ACP5HU_00450 [Phycisphaerae bacterium]
MASYRLNVARIQGCPAPKDVDQAMADFALPETEEFGVLNHSATSAAAFGTMVRKTQQSVQTLDEEAGEVTASSVERVQVYPFAVRPEAEILEVYAGSASAIEQLATFFSSCLALPTVVETIELDVLSAIEKLSKSTQRFQLRSARVSDYAHNSYMAGAYAPKFLDSQHGVNFLEEYADFVSTAQVRFAGPSGRVNVHLSPKACFRYSCHEDDQATVQSILRKLL